MLVPWRSSGGPNTLSIRWNILDAFVNRKDIGIVRPVLQIMLNTYDPLPQESNSSHDLNLETQRTYSLVIDQAGHVLKAMGTVSASV